MAVTIEVVGAEELIAKLDTLKKMERVKAAIETAADDLKGYLQEYPKNAHGPNPGLRGKGDKANRMRRGFFFKLKSGEITVPYSRTDFLGQRWGYKLESEGWTAVIGNNVPYNDWVQGPGQTAGHANSGWLTVDKAKETYGPAVIQQIMDALEEEVENV